MIPSSKLALWGDEIELYTNIAKQGKHPFILILVQGIAGTAITECSSLPVLESIKDYGDCEQWLNTVPHVPLSPGVYKVIGGVTNLGTEEEEWEANLEQIS